MTPSHLYFLSPSHERRLQKLMRSTSTHAHRLPLSTSGTPPTRSQGSGGAELLLFLLPPSPPPSVVTTPSLASAPSPPRVDLLRLVFLRFIHLTGLVVQEGLISGSHLIYNQPTVPLPLAHPQRWDERRRSGTWDPAQFSTDATGASRPASPSSSAPSLPLIHPLSLPPRLPTTSGSSLRRTSNSSNHLPTLPNLRSQTTQPQSIHRSTSSTSLHPQPPIDPQRISLSTPLPPPMPARAAAIFPSSRPPRPSPPLPSFSSTSDPWRTSTSPPSVSR